MTRSEKLRRRLEEERRRSPGLSPLDLALKFNVSEGTIIGLLGGGSARRVRGEFQEKILDELRAWGHVILHIHNDFAECEANCTLDAVALKAGLLTVRAPSILFRIDYARVESVFFVEYGGRSSIQFFNRRGHSVFQVLPPAGKENSDRFRNLRDSLCMATIGGRA
jgi:putative heme degradation protein